MKRLLFLLALLIPLCARSQPFFVDQTTVTTNVTTAVGAITIPGVTAMTPYSRRDTNTIIGDPIPAAFNKLNIDINFLYQLILAGGGGGGGGGTGPFLNLIDTNTLSIISTNISGYQLVSVVVNTPGMFTNCDLTTNSTYVLDNDPSSAWYRFLTNNCTNSYAPLGQTNITNIFGSVVGNDTDVSNYMINAGLGNNTNILQALAVGQLVQDLKANGLYSNFFAIYPFAAGTVLGDAVNLVSNNVSYSIGWAGFMNTPAAHGIWGISNNNSAGSWGDTHLVESSITPSVLNDFSLLAWTTPISTVGGFNAFIGSKHWGGFNFDMQSGVGAQTTVSGYFITGGVNVSTAGWNPPAVHQLNSGFSGVTRFDPSTYYTFAENLFSPYVRSSTTVPPGNIYVGNTYQGFPNNLPNNADTSLCSIGFAAIGRGFSLQQMALLQAIIDNYCASRPSSPANSYTGLPGLPGSTFNSGFNQATNIFTVWVPYTTNSWILLVSAPSCGFGGPCFTGPVIKCNNPNGQWYMLSPSYTNDPTGQKVCTFCQTH